MSDAVDGGEAPNGGTKRSRDDAEVEEEEEESAVAAEETAVSGSGVTSTTQQEGEAEPPQKVARLGEPGDQFADADEESDCGTPPSDPPPEGATATSNPGTNPGATTHPEPQPDTAAESAEDPVPATAPTTSGEATSTVEGQSNPGTHHIAASSNAPGNPGNAPALDVPTDASPPPAEDATQLFTVDRSGTDPSQVVQPAIPPSNPGPTSHPPAGNPASPTPHPPTTDPSGLPPGVPPGVFPPAQAPNIPEAPAPVDPPVLQPTLAHPGAELQQVEEREEISAQVVGKVIGKGGEMIRDLQARSGARIDVDQNVPSGLPRIVTYRGTRQTVDLARSLVRMLTMDGVSETDLPLGQASREILAVPAPSVGKVIGRGGEMIRELQSRSGAKIQVDHHSSTGSGVPPDQKKVTIIGTEQSVVKAKEMVMFLVTNPMMDAMQALLMLIEDKLRGNSWGTGPPYPNMPNQGYNMSPEMVAPAAMGGGGGYPAYQPQPAYGAPAATGGYGMPAQLPAAPYQPAGYGQYNAASPPATAGAVEVDVTYVQRQYTGRIIGQRGVTVNDLQRRSGCDIQVNQQQSSNSAETEITIRGTRQGIDMVKQMIREIIEAGPGHPYAGGADSGYGTGGQFGGGAGAGGGGGGYGKYPPQQQGYEYAQAYGVYAQPGYGQAAPQQQAAPYAPQQQMAATQAYGAAYGGVGYAMQGQQGAYAAAAAPMAGGYGYGAQAAVAPAPQPQASPWKAAPTPDGQGKVLFG